MRKCKNYLPAHIRITAAKLADNFVII